MNLSDLKGKVIYWRRKNGKDGKVHDIFQALVRDKHGDIIELVDSTWRTSHYVLLSEIEICHIIDEHTEKPPKDDDGKEAPATRTTP